MSLNIDRDIAYQFSLVKREPGEHDGTLAARLYNIQSDVFDANTNGAIAPRTPFDQLSVADKIHWLSIATEYK